jgi:hypothetical protein
MLVSAALSDKPAHARFATPCHSQCSSVSTSVSSRRHYVGRRQGSCDGSFGTDKTTRVNIPVLSRLGQPGYPDQTICPPPPPQGSAMSPPVPALASGRPARTLAPVAFALALVSTPALTLPTYILTVFKALCRQVVLVRARAMIHFFLGCRKSEGHLRMSLPQQLRAGTLRAAPRPSSVRWAASILQNQATSSATSPP